MKEKTKERLKTVSLIAGSFVGSCASSYACAVLTTICPPVGIPATIGKFVIGSMVAEKAAEHAWGMADAVIEGADATQTLIEDFKAAKENEETSEEVEA